MITPEEKQRIEKDAIDYAYNSDQVKGYIAGAEAEHPIAWNKAVEACILEAFKDDGSHWIDLRNKLEALKHKQP